MWLENPIKWDKKPDKKRKKDRKEKKREKREKDGVDMRQPRREVDTSVG